MNDDLEITYTTSRVDQDCRCCRCGDDDTIANMLKVVWGNDMTVSIKLAVKEDDQYVDYDLTDVEDMVVNVVSPYQDRIQVDSFITANKIQAIIDSNVLESNVPYGIELIWKDGPYDKRAFAKNMFMFVNSSIEATDSAYRYDPQNPYEYNIIMENDTCYISIGQIPEIDLSNYVTQGELTTSLDALWQDCNSTFIDHEELADAISDLDLSAYVSNTELETILENASYVTESSLNTTLSGYVTQTYLDSNYPSYTYLYSYVGDAISGVTIDESNLVHKTGNEDISGTKHFLNRVLMNQGLSVSGNVLLNSGQGLLSQNVLELVSNSLQAARISSNQIATSDIIAPSDNYNNGDFSGTKDTITFYKDTNTSPYYLTLSPIAKIDSNGIYEGTTLLSDKYLQIADLPSIPAYTSDLVNNSGFLTQSDIDNMSYVTYNEVEQILEDSSYATQSYVTEAISQIPQPDLSSYVTYTYLEANYPDYAYLEDALSNISPSVDLSSYVTYIDWDNTNEAIAQELTDNRLAHIDINNQFSNYYTKTDSDSRYATQSWANSKFVTQSDDVNRQQAIAAAFSQSQDDLDSLDTRVTTLENNPSVPSNVVTSDDGNEIICLTQSQYDTLEQNQQLESDVFYYITDATSNYVTQSSLDAMSYVTDTDLQTTISGLSIPTATSDLNNDSGFVSSSSVTTIWKGSQSDYNNISNPDPNTLYVIV